jgi:hypothetical protein
MRWMRDTRRGCAAMYEVGVWTLEVDVIGEATATHEAGA